MTNAAYILLFGYEDYNADVSFYADGALLSFTEHGDAPSQLSPETAIELAHALTDWAAKEELNRRITDHDETYPWFDDEYRYRVLYGHIGAVEPWEWGQDAMLAWEDYTNLRGLRGDEDDWRREGRTVGPN